MPEPNPQRGMELATVVVTGPLTRHEAVRWHKAFADGLVRGRGLCIDLTESGPWDVAGVQLLLAAIASGQRFGWPVRLTGVPDVLTSVAKRAGLLDRLAAITED